jgi:hypothetical protein
MAAKKGGDSKQGLIITLVCFVVLSLALGLTTYLGFSGKADAEDKAADAAKKEKEANGVKDWYKTQCATMRTSLGFPPAAGDAAAEKAEVTKTVETIQAETANMPGKNFKDEFARLNTELANTRAKLEEAEKNLKKAKEDRDTQIATKEAEVQEWQKKFKEAQASNLKEKQEQETNFAQQLEVFGDQNKTIGDLKKKSEEDTSTTEKKIKKLETEKQQLTRGNEKLKEKLTPVDILRFSTPKGRITDLDPKGEIAWINVGSADNIRPNQALTFSVFGTGQGGKADNVRKGSIEVVDVLAPHLSQAKITEVVDPGRNPLLKGDLLINPAWNPQTREHVAIAGMIDLTGEGRDNTEEFLNNLKKQGMVIDAFLDLNDLTVKGEGMTTETTYLILGAQPEFSERENIKLDETADARRPDVKKLDIIRKVAEMQKEANEKGITIVPLHKFVAWTGYRLPKGAGVTSGFGSEKVKKAFPSPEKASEKKSEKSKESKEDEKKDDSDK